MQTRSYRLTVLGNALVWLLAGLHLPTLHELTDHGWSAPTSVRVMTAMLVLVGAALVWVLLRASTRGSAGSARDATP